MAKPIRLDAIVGSHRSRLLAEDSPVAPLDDRTWQDLNLDDVVGAIDRTESTLGRHALYHRLRTTAPIDDLYTFERLVTQVGTDDGMARRARRLLARLQDPHGYDLWWLAKPGAIVTEWWYGVFPLLAIISLLLLAFTFAWPALLPALIASLIVNAAVGYAVTRRIQAIAGAFRQVAPVVATAASLRFLCDANPDAIIQPLRDDTPSLGRLKTIARWISGDPFLLRLSPSPLLVLVSDVVQVIYEYFNFAFLLDANGIYFGAGELRRRGAALLRVAAAAGDVDAALSVAALRAERSDWIRPRFHAPGAPTVLVDARHPLLDEAVPNSITMEPGAGILITGSNMSGKSTFLRTVGVNVVLAQTLNTCFAARYEAPVLRVRSSIGRSDDLLSGKSYYVAEVESLLGLVRAAATAPPHLFLLDELFRGTNAVERIAAGQAVLGQLLDDADRPSPHLAIAATHDAELVDLLRDRYASHHFSDDVGPEGLVFDHRLRPGPATTRNAIALLRLHGAPDRLVERALACAETLDRERGANTLRAR